MHPSDASPRHAVGSAWGDHFSTQADSYGRYRPVYPEDLYDWLAAQSPRRELAWDCGTGSGQVARGLAGRFSRVVATDASLRQLAHARAAAGVHFVAGRSDLAPLRSGAVDMVGMGAAIHWFAGEPFFAEVRRIVRLGGLVAAWTYWLMDAGAAVTPVIRAFRRDVVFDYWPPGREHVESEYRTLPFPFDEIEAPRFEARARWTAEELVGYIGTWSSVQRYRAQNGEDPLPALAQEILDAWGTDSTREIRWPLHLRVGFVRSR